MSSTGNGSGVVPNAKKGSEGSNQSGGPIIPHGMWVEEPVESSDTSTGGCRARRFTELGPKEKIFLAYHENYLFTDLLPKGTEHWAISKWIELLKFADVDWETERKFYKWSMEVARACCRTNPTYAVFQNVLRFTVPQRYQVALRIADATCNRIDTDDFFTRVSGYLFRFDDEVFKTERDLMSPKQSRSVMEAVDQFAEMLATYQAMCKRRNRHSIMGPEQTTEGLACRFPERISRLLRSEKKFAEYDIMELIVRALHLESAEATSYRMEAYPVEEDGWRMDDEYRQQLNTSQSSNSKNPCRKCGQAGHIAKSCRLGDVRCQICEKVGHIAAACYSYVRQDQGGRPKLTVTPNNKGAQIKVQFDNTMPDAVESMGGVVKSLSQSFQKRRDDSARRYREKKAQESKEVKEKTKHVVMHQDVSEDGQTSDQQGAYVVETDSDDDVDEPSWIGHVDEQVGDVVRSEFSINGSLRSAVLDSGAKSDCMSLKDSQDMGIKIDSSIRRTVVKGVGGLAVSRISQIVVVSHPLSPTKQVETRFRLVNDDIPTLIGRPTLTALGVTLDFGNKKLVIDGKSEDLVFTVDVPDKKEARIETLSQRIHKTPKEAVDAAIKDVGEGIEDPVTARENLCSLLMRYQELFWEPKAGNCKTHTMSVKVDGKPKRFRARNCPPPLLKEMIEQVEDLERQKVILPMPDNEWVAPCMLVPKKRGIKWRLVIDYRYVNSLMVDDPYPVPNIIDIFNDMGGNRYFSLLDLNWGFWNLPLHPDSVKYTGFAVPGKGVYVWVVAPFGLKVSPTHFQKCIEMCLSELLTSGKVHVYIDDIVISTATVSEHLRILESVLHKLKESGFFINLAKAHILRLKVPLLGHVISENRLEPDPGKLQGIIAAQVPRNKDEVRSLVAAASFLRMYIPGFSEVTAPLSDLTKSKVRFEWGEAEQNSFMQLKQLMLDATYLILPDYSKPFAVFCDASEIALGAVLSQEIEGSLKYVAFASKKLTEGQRNWSASEREVYAVVFACERFEGYIKGCAVTVHSDHAALKYLQTATSPKLKRWALRLLEFGPTIKFVPGKDNAMADWLSRSRSLQDEELPPYAYVPVVYYLTHEPSAFPVTVPSAEDMAQEARLDEKSKLCPPLRWVDEVAYHHRSSKRYVPVKFRNEVVLWFHGSRYGGHQGIRRTESRIKKYVWWPGIRQSVEEVINSCPLCNFYKSITHNRKVPGALSKPNLFDLLSIDFIGPRKVFGNKWYICVLVDHCSRFMVSAACPTPSAQAAIDLIRSSWMPSFGSPGSVLCDHGGAFTAKEFMDFVVTELRSRLVYASVEYPQGNGINEASHKVLETAIKCSPRWLDSNFPTLVNEATLIYNSSPNMQIGDTPASFLYGIDPCLPGLENVYVSVPEQARRISLRDRRLWILLDELAKESSKNPTSECDDNLFNLGDIVTRRLYDSEIDHYQNISGEQKYAARRSLPYRVLKTKEGALIITPLLSNAPPITVPKAECKKITSSSDKRLCGEAAKLFPSISQQLLELPSSTSSPSAANNSIMQTSADDESSAKHLEVRLKRVRRGSFDDLFQ